MVTWAAVPAIAGHQGDRCRPAADDDDLLAAVVEVLGPVLRVHDLTAESVATRELRGVALVVAVVPACAEDPVRTELHQFLGVVRGAEALDVDRPARVIARPGRAENLVVEPDFGVDVVLRDGLAQVGQNLVRRRDGILVAPRLELVAEGVQIGIRSNPGIPEQIPRAAGCAARLEDGVGPAGVILLQVVRGADAGDAGADDQDVDVLDAGGGVGHGGDS